MPFLNGICHDQTLNFIRILLAEVYQPEEFFKVLNARMEEHSHRWTA